MKRQPFYLFLVQAIREQLNERMGDDHAGEQSTIIIIIILGMNESQLFRGGDLYIFTQDESKKINGRDGSTRLPTYYTCYIIVIIIIVHLRWYYIQVLTKAGSGQVWSGQVRSEVRFLNVMIINNFHTSSPVSPSLPLTGTRQGSRVIRRL